MNANEWMTRGYKLLVVAVCEPKKGLTAIDLLIDSCTRSISHDTCIYHEPTYVPIYRQDDVADAA